MAANATDPAMLSANSQRLNLTLAALAAVFCLSPLFVLTIQNRFISDDALNYQDLIGGVRENSFSHLSSFFVILIPAADLFLDFPFQDSSSLRDVRSSRSTEKSTVIFRLNDIERLLFIIGVAIQSSVWFMPLSTDVATLGLVYDTTTNASVLLVLVPIVTYLQRSTTSFTTFRASFLSMSTSFGLMLFTTGDFFQSDGIDRITVKLLAWAVTGLSAFLYFSVIGLCAFKYFRRKLRTPLDREAFLALLTNIFRRSAPGIEPKQRKENAYEIYCNYIPALHMFASMTLVVAYCCIKPLNAYDHTIVYESRTWVVIASEVLVLVIELRIRKNEVARALIALLESKKSYVRHISHELRTPLNTAFLGLKLLSSELKASSDPKDMERYDTLCDVNTSCKAAVDILNDLLCYEKLESGILELHKENVVVDSFLKSCLSMFSAHARECGVTMTMTMVTDTDRDDDIPSVSLQPHDSIFADKFKMDQVIRNLISNALKFTPRGGHVTVKATFVQDSEIESPRYHHDHAGKLLDTPPPIRMKRKIGSFLNIAKNRKLSMIGHVDDGAVADEAAYAEVRGKLVIVVADTGAGISKENQKRLFTEIVQFNPEKLQAGGGSGLGLWITQEILNLHDGSISVSSDGEGMGSIFTVEMPMIRRPLTASPLAVTIEDEFFTDEIGSDRNRDRDRDRDQDLLPPETVVDDTVTELADSPQSPFELLIVDDSRLCRKMLQKCLRADGHTCFEAEDGLEAIEMVKKRIDHANGGNGRPFDAILMDFIMPNMDGPTATKEIRALGYNAPMYGVTGNGLPSDIEHYLNCGADRVLLKPLDLSAFRQAMRDMTDTSA